MDPIKDYEEVLHDLERAVVNIWRAHPELTNYCVARAYEAAAVRYRDEAREYTPKPVTLTGLDLAVYEAVRDRCEFTLGRGGEPLPSGAKPIPLADLVACLNKLRKSVQFWTEQGGRQGYMEFIAGYV